MAISGDPEILGAEAVRARDAAREAIGEDLYSMVEYDERSFNALYVSEDALALYESEAQMWDHWEHIHSYVHLDFTEQELFQEELLPGAGEVTHLATGFEFMTVVRILYDRRGVFVSMSPDAATDDVVAAVRSVLG